MCAKVVVKRCRALTAVVAAVLTGVAAGACSARAERASGNRSSADGPQPAQGPIKQPSLVLTDDGNPLSVRWLAPVDGRTVSGTLSGSSCQVATRDSFGVTKVNFYLDGSLLGTATTPPYTCQLDADVLSGGTHILKAEAYDATGNALSAYSFVSIPTGAPEIPVTVQGDSLTVGSWWRMPEHLGPSFKLVSVSAHDGRPAVKGVELLRKQPLGHIVVFALGTNDWWASPSAYREHLTKVLQIIGPTRCLVVPTIWRGGPAVAWNRILRSLAERYGPHRMQLAPWAEAVAAGRVVLPDGTHPASQAGWEIRGQLVDTAVRACARA